MQFRYKCIGVPVRFFKTHFLKFIAIQTFLIVYFQADLSSRDIIESFWHKLNSFAVPLVDLKCAEYCFRCCMNPLQHPSLDPNIHHLVAMVTALGNTCGGVLFLAAPSGILREEIKFSKFQTRLQEMLPASAILLSPLSAFAEIPEYDQFWAVLVVKKGQQFLPYRLGRNSLQLWGDINGRLHYIPHQQSIAETKGKPLNESSESAAPSARTTQATRSLVGTETLDTVETYTPVECSTLRELNWDQHKSNWKQTLKVLNHSTEEIVSSCSIWQPDMPMQLTPDKEVLAYFFLSESEMKQTLKRIECKVPGFAIASRTWLSLLPEHHIHASRPARHLCDVLTVSQQCEVCLWVVVSESRENLISEQLQYAMIVGRTIKYQIAKHNRWASNLTIRCMLHSTQAGNNELIENTLTQSGIFCTHELLNPLFQEQCNFGTLQRGIALLLLAKESHIKNCAGDQIGVKLSAKQAMTLLNRKRVTYISAAPGTGKTFCGISLYREFGKDYSVYMCTTQPLLQYVRYNGCEGTLVLNDEDLCRNIDIGTFDNKKCVIIDESHQLRCSKVSLEKLFLTLKKNGQCFLFVFADNEYQSFDVQNQQNIANYIFKLSKKVLGIIPHMDTFTEIYRNTRKVTSFLQHAMQDTKSNVADIACGNKVDGDGIQCIVMEHVWNNSRDNELVRYLSPYMDAASSFTPAKYHVTGVAVLLHAKYMTSDIQALREIMRTQFPRITIQSADEFPRKGIIVDRVENFIGLDAALCIFLLSPREEAPDLTMHNPRYRIFLASRATHKAVFVVPQIDPTLIQCMKFDRIRASIIGPWRYRYITGTSCGSRCICCQ